MGLERTSVIMQKEILQMRKEGHSMRIIARHLRVCRKTIQKVFEQQDQGLAVTQESYRNKDFDVFDWDEIERELHQATPMNVLVHELREQHQMDISYMNFYREVRRRFPAKKIVTLRKVHQPAKSAN